MKENIEKVIGSGNTSKVEEIEVELADLQKELLKKANARQAYDDIADKIEELRRKKQELLLEDANNEEYLIRRMRCHPARASAMDALLLCQIFLRS